MESYIADLSYPFLFFMVGLRQCVQPICACLVLPRAHAYSVILAHYIRCYSVVASYYVAASSELHCNTSERMRKKKEQLNYLKICTSLNSTLVLACLLLFYPRSFSL